MRCFKESKLHLSLSTFDQKKMSQFVQTMEPALTVTVSFPVGPILKGSQPISNGSRQQNLPRAGGTFLSLKHIVSLSLGIFCADQR